MMKDCPVEAENGLHLTPTVFGDWLYNLGYVRVLIISLLLGVKIRKVDKSENYF